LINGFLEVCLTEMLQNRIRFELIQQFLPFLLLPIFSIAVFLASLEIMV